MYGDRRTFLGTAATAAVALAIGMASGGSSFAQTEIKVGRTPGASGFHVPSYVAMENGFFKREGLDASYVSMTGSALITAGMGGAVDFVPIPGGGTQAILKGAKLRFVCGESLISQWAIVVDPKITSVEQLKGKTLGYGRPGAADYDEGEITLHRFFNMDVGRDYKVISFQGEPERIAALINGSIEGGLMSFPHAAKAATNGFKILIRTGDYLPRVGGVFWVTEKYMENNRETVGKFVRAMAKATAYLKHDKAGSVPVIQKYFGIDNPKEAGFIWDTVHDQYSPDIPHSLLQKLFDGRVKRMQGRGLWPKDKPAPDPEQYVERELLTSTLRELGYYLQAPPQDQGKLN